MESNIISVIAFWEGKMQSETKEVKTVKLYKELSSKKATKWTKTEAELKITTKCKELP